MNQIIDRDLVNGFNARHTPDEIAIFEVIQEADILELIWDLEKQCGAYLLDAEDLLPLLKETPEPDFDKVVDWLSWQFERVIDLERTNTRYHDLACKILTIVYDQSAEPA